MCPSGWGGACQPLQLTMRTAALSRRRQRRPWPGLGRRLALGTHQARALCKYAPLGHWVIASAPDNARRFSSRRTSCLTTFAKMTCRHSLSGACPCCYSLVHHCRFIPAIAHEKVINAPRRTMTCLIVDGGFLATLVYTTLWKCDTAVRGSALGICEGSHLPAAITKVLAVGSLSLAK